MHSFLYDNKLPIRVQRVKSSGMDVFGSICAHLVALGVCVEFVGELITSTFGGRFFDDKFEKRRDHRDRVSLA